MSDTVSILWRLRRTAIWLGLLALIAGGAAGTAAGSSFPQSPGAATPSDGERAGGLHLIILHTNDLHGQVLPRPAFRAGVPNPPLAGGLVRIGGYVNQVRREAAATSAELLVLDAGDWSQGTPEGAFHQGRDFLNALALVGYDAMCVGNHEFDHGVDVLEESLSSVALPAVIANVRRADGTPVPGLPSHRVFNRGGMRIAVIGLISADTPRITHPSAREWQFAEPAAVLSEVRAQLAAEADWVLPLTHLGVNGDRELARSHPDLDLIVGGHSHTLLPTGLVEGSTRIVQAGSKASAIGRVDVWFDVVEKRVVKLEARVVNLFREPQAEDQNHELRAECQAMLERGSEALDATIGSLAAPMLRADRRLTSSPAGNLICDAMRSATGAHVAIQNRGGIRADLYAGVVTRRDLFNVLPFSNHLVVLHLSGRELEACVRRAVEGAGRRGPEVSGMSLTLRRDGRNFQLAAITIDGRPLDPDGEYELATNSFLATGGDGYEELVGAERGDQPVTLLREVVGAVFAGGEPVTPPTENRYVFVD